MPNVFKINVFFSRSIRKYTCIDSSEQKRPRKAKPALMGLGFCRAVGEGRVERRGEWKQDGRDKDE